MMAESTNVLYDTKVFFFFKQDAKEFSYLKICHGGNKSKIVGLWLKN